MQLGITEDIVLESTCISHAEELFAAVDANREHLGAFLPWVVWMRTVEDMRAYTRKCESLAAESAEISFVIRYQQRIVGRIGLHYIHQHNRSGAIGYWLTKDAEGKGIMLRACKALIAHAFDAMDMHRIEIKAATLNQRSQAVPEKLGFTKEGILREAELVNGEFVDLFLYSLLRN